MSEDEAYQKLHRINIALGRLCKGEITKEAYDEEIKRPTLQVPVVAARAGDRGDAENPLLLDEVPGAVSTGGESSGADKETLPLQESEHTDDTRDTRIDEIMGKILKNTLSG